MRGLVSDVKDTSVYRRLLDVNTLGAVYPTHYCLPLLKRAGALWLWWIGWFKESCLPFSLFRSISLFLFLSFSLFLFLSLSPSISWPLYLFLFPHFSLLFSPFLLRFFPFSLPSSCNIPLLHHLAFNWFHFLLQTILHLTPKLAICFIFPSLCPCLICIHCTLPRRSRCCHLKCIRSIWPDGFGWVLHE